MSFVANIKDVYFSVVIITHNREIFIKDAIESVLRQSFINFELIIIDDASTDNTQDVVSVFLSDDRVKYFKVKKCSSISEVRNIAIKKAVGKYMAVLDSDDVWSDNLKLQKQFNFLQNNNFVVIGGSAILINEKNENIGFSLKPVDNNTIIKNFFKKNPFIHSSVVVPLNLVREIGGYDEGLRFGEDLDLFLRLSKFGLVANLPDILVKYRVHSDNEAKKNKSRAIFDVIKIIKKYKGSNHFPVFTVVKKILIKFLEYFK